MDLQHVKLDLLDEGRSRVGGHIFLLNDDNGAYLKGHGSPEEERDNYLLALESLLLEGTITLLFQNHEFKLFTVSDVALLLPTVQYAKERILQELETNRLIYKVHSAKGEFVQCTNANFVDHETIRITYLKALGELLYSGKLDVVSDNEQLCVYKSAKDSYSKNFETDEQPAASAPPNTPLELCA